jgi:carbon monoxide dehydrogenase subunit G
MRLSGEITIESPPDHVWEIVAHRFDRVGEWATAIKASRPIESNEPGTGAPVAGRVCETGVPMAADVTERIVAYDAAGRSLSYVGTGLPAFVASASNHWQVTRIDEQRTRVRLDATVETIGIFGRMLRPAMWLQINHEGRRFLKDLKYFAEHNRPSSSKQRRLKSARFRR